MKKWMKTTAWFAVGVGAVPVYLLATSTYSPTLGPGLVLTCIFSGALTVFLFNNSP